MKKLVYILAVVGFTLNTTVHAIEPVSESVAKLYYSLPLGVSAHKRLAPSFGFRVDYQHLLLRDNMDITSFSPKSLIDFQYNHDGLQGVYVNGLDTLVKKTTYNADSGTVATVKSLDWVLVGIGVAGAAIVVDQAVDDPAPVNNCPNFTSAIANINNPCPR